jgi:glutamyl-tRNA reductase
MTVVNTSPLRNHFGLIGTSVWQQNTALLERLTINRDEIERVLPELKKYLRVNELLYLSTCNRVEFLFTTTGQIHGTRILHRLIDFFFRHGKDVSFFPNDFFAFQGRAAVSHLFRVASSLESVVIGETQIAGQLSEALAQSRNFGVCGSTLEDIVSKALLASKRVRRETNIGAGAVSMASLAFNAISSHLADNKSSRVALVGSGPMTRKMAVYLTEAGFNNLLFVNRTIETIRPIAQEFNALSMSLEGFHANPPQVGAIVSATAAPEALFDAAFCRRLRQSDQPVLCVDLAIPRDFAPESSSIENIRLVDIPSLKAAGNRNLREKFIEAGKANDIVREEVAKYFAGQLHVTMKPLFHQCRQESLEMARRALNDLFDGRLSSLSNHDRQIVAELVEKIVNHSSFLPARLLSEHLAGSGTDIPALATWESSGQRRIAV